MYIMCVRTQIHHVKISLLLLEMLGNIFCSVCRNCKPFAPPRPACSTAVLQGEIHPEMEGANYSGRGKIIKLNNRNASYYVNNNRGTFAVESFIKVATTHAGHSANISRP